MLREARPRFRAAVRLMRFWIRLREGSLEQFAESLARHLRPSFLRIGGGLERFIGALRRHAVGWAAHASSMAHLFVGVGAFNSAGPKKRSLRFVVVGARDGGVSVPAAQVLARGDGGGQSFDAESREQRD